MNIQYFYYLTAYFLLYSFLGWCLEVAYHGVSKGVIVNRGFLNGPICPIYGVGMICVLTVLEPLRHHPLPLFICGTIFATLIELAGGFILYKLFHMRWWDYSKEPLNLGGFICAKFSLAWGFCILFAVLIVHPFIELNVNLMDCLPGYIFTIVCYSFFVADCIITVLTMTKLNSKLRRLNNLAMKMRNFSDNLTEKIGKKSLEAGARLQEGHVQATLGQAEMNDEISRIRESIIRHRHYSYGRMMRAFPDAEHEMYKDEYTNAVLAMKEHRAMVLKARAERRESREAAKAASAAKKNNL